MRLLKAISLASAAIIMIGAVHAKDLIAPTNQLTILHINDHHSHLRADGRMSLNIGGEKTIQIKELVKLIEGITGRKAKIKLVKKNKLDPVKSLASNFSIKKFSNFKNSTSIKMGLEKVYNSFND